MSEESTSLQIANEEADADPVVAAPIEEIAVKAEEPGDVTQVKTLQQMSVEQNVQLPKEMTPEQLDGQLLLDHFYGLQTVVPAFQKLGKNGMIRLWTAIMQLPQEGLKVNLNGTLEKQIYLAAQKTQYAKNAIIFRRMKKEADAERKATAETEKNRLQNIPLNDTLESSKETEIKLNDNETIKENANV